MFRKVCTLAGLAAITFALYAVALPLAVAFVGVALVLYGEGS